MQYITDADPVIVGSFANAQSKRATNLRRVARRYTAILRSAPECSITLWVGAASALNIVAVKEHSPV